MINCLIIDDEPLARECIANYIAEIDFLQLTGTGINAVELTQLLDIHDIQLVFLDIQMPVMNGIDYLRMSKKPPMVIITTAYPSYALEGFQLDVLDYLVKPITFDRFFKAVNKAKEYYQLLTRPVAAEDYFFIKCDYKYEKVVLNDILYIEALQNYVAIYSSKGKYITLLNLKSVEEHLDAQSFMRVHKSYIVPIAKIDTIGNNEIVVQSFRIPIGRGYREEVISRIINKKLLKKGDDV